MAPVHPEDKCSSRKRRLPSASLTTTASPMHLLDEHDLLDAALFDCDDSEVDWDDAAETQNHLKRLCVAVSDAADMEEQQLSEEVQTLKASVHSMAANVAKAAQKVDELRALIVLLVEQQEDAGN